MLVALAVTLVMMAAVVNLFANISGSIRNRRAVIEVSGQLRQVRSRLALDLAGATCTGQTWQRPSEDVGYIEIIEGEASDMFPSLLVDGVPVATDYREIDYATSLVPSGGDPTIDFSATIPPLSVRAPQPGDVTNGRALGDWDDILALTVRSEAEPFKTYVGGAGGTRIESNIAEVVWYADENVVDDPATATDDESLDPANGVRREPGMRRIYRRVYVIAPWLGPWTYTTSGDENRPQNISVRFVPGSAPNTGQWVANTLGDLTKRENRVCRDYDATIPTASLFPHAFNRDRLSFNSEFLALADGLALDVRVYEGGAPLFPYAPRNRQPISQDAIVQPGDPGWIYAATEYNERSNPPAPATKTPAGYGAYCDLGWNWNPVTNAVHVPLSTSEPIRFWMGRRAGWHPSFSALAPPQPLTGFPAVYDTWSFHYENDGINQEEVLIQAATNAGISPLPVFADWQKNTLDQGTNGLDDEVLPGNPPTVGINGVDDPGERETSPPYDVPLRGVKVSLRIYERDARQIRETSVTHSFAN